MCKVEIKVGGVMLELTPEQLAQIDKQRSVYTHYTQVDSYETACKVLKKDIDEKTDCVTKLRTIGKAINSLIVIKGKFPDWKDRDQKKHYPYFECDRSGRWLYYGSAYRYYLSFSEVLYLKSEEAAVYMGKTFLSLYSEMLNEEM